MARTHRLAPGLYRTTDDRYTVERVTPEARDAGYGDGWHVFDEAATVYGLDRYCGTFATKADALNYVDNVAPYRIAT